MKFNQLAVTGSLATALCFGAGWAQQAPSAQSETEPATKSAKSGVKEKHLSGSLVDVACMAKTLGAETGDAPQTEPAPGVPHFVGGGADPQAGPGQMPAGGGPGGMQDPNHRNPQSSMPPDTRAPGMSADDQVQTARSNKIDNAVKQCAASPSAQTLGLATSDGQVLQFDQDGNAKAKEALNSAANLQPGKKIKAKVTGTIEDKGTVNVASIEIKGKGKHGSGAANPGS